MGEAGKTSDIYEHPAVFPAVGHEPWVWPVFFQSAPGLRNPRVPGTLFCLNVGVGADVIAQGARLDTDPSQHLPACSEHRQACPGDGHGDKTPKSDSCTCR